MKGYTVAGWKFPLSVGAGGAIVRRPGGAVLLLSTLLCLASALLIWRQATRTFDGARIEPGSFAWQGAGVVVAPLHSEAGGLQTGDIVVAVAGQEIDAWAQTLFLPGAPLPPWQEGDAIGYTVVRRGERLQVAVRLGRYPLAVLLARNWSAVLLALSTLLITLFVLWRRPSDVAARALFVWAWSLSLAMTWLLGLQVYDLVDRRRFWLFLLSTTGAWLLSWGAILHFALVFPQPHALVARRPHIVHAVYAAPFALYLLYIAGSWPFAASTLDWLQRWQGGDWAVAVVYLTAAIIVIVQQYLASYGATRQQIRWLVFAALLSLGAILLLWFLPSILVGRSLINTGALGLLALPYPLALAVGLLRHHLFDIDIIIRRTLVYSVLTLALTVLYFASVILLQLLLRPFVLQEQSQVATSLATLGIAALFRPLRSRIQAAIDRRFYRRKYDREKVLAAFSARVRDETDLDQLVAQLAATALETLQPAHLSVWLVGRGGATGQPLQANAQFAAVMVQS